MTIYLILFASSFITVFALGFQSLNVNGGHYLSAASTSVFIGVGHIALYKLVPEAGLSELLAYLAGGPLGITASMYIHRLTVGKARPPVLPLGASTVRNIRTVENMNPPADYPKPPPPPPLQFPNRARRPRSGDDMPPFI